MSLLSEIKEKNKKKNSNNTRIIIRNQKLMNIVRAILFLTLIIADLVYIIKENIIGISYFTHIVLLVSLILESLIFIGLAVLKFNTENKILKIISTAVFAIPVIAYIPMMGYGDGFSIILFITRLILVLVLLYIATKEKTQFRGKLFVIRQISYLLMASIIFVITFLLLITSQSRRVLYSYDDELDGYVVKNILNGSSDVVFKDGTIKISDNSLKNAGKVITIPETVNEVSNNAFLNSNVEEVYLNSSNITIVDALNNSNVKKVYINNPDLEIKDLAKASRRSKFKFYLSKDVIDEYREKNRRYDYLFSPICDEGEYFVAYNNTSLPIEYYKLDDYVNSPKVTTTEKKRFSDWIYAFSNESASDIKFPLKVTDNIELFALWDVVYTINIDYDNATVVNQDDYWDDMPKSIDVTIRDGNIILPILEKPGYRFEGWYKADDYSFFDDNIISTSIIDDMDIRARFSKIYILDYELNGGELSDEEMYAEYVDGDIITPATPTRFGYEFAGWYDNKEFEGYAINKVYNLKTKLYAKWNLIAPVVTVSNDINKVYDNNPTSISLDINHPLINDENFSIAYKWYKNDETKVISTKSTYNVIEAQNNKYYCHVTIKHLGNVYELDSDYINVNIEKADYDLSNIDFDEFKFEFNGSQQIPSINTQIKGLDGIAVIVQYSYTGYFTKVDDMGTITATFTTDSENYNVPSPKTATVEIVQKELSIEYDSLSFVYDGNQHKPIVSLIGEIEGYPVELQYQNIVTTDAGTYDILVNISDNEHYKLDIETITYSIEKADYNLSSIEFDTTQFEYDGNSHIPNPINLISGLSLDVNNSIGAKDIKDTKAILRFINTNNNYNTPNELEVNVTINPKQIDVLLDKTEFIYNGNKQVPNATLTGIVSGDDISCVSLNDSINYGTYTFNFELRGKHKDNYKVSNSSYNISYVIKKGSYDLSKLSYDVTSFDYDGNSHIPNPTNLPIGLELDISKSVGAINVLDTKATLHFINNDLNYANPSDLVVDVIIKPKMVTISVIETGLTYQKKLLLPTVELEGIINNDDVNANILNTDSINAGKYTLNAELIGSDKANYVIDELNSSLEYSIGKADFEIQYVLKDNTVFTYDGQLHHPELDLVNGKMKYYTAYKDEITINYIDEYKNVGTYSAKVRFSVSGNSENYVDAKTQSYNLTINKKEVSLEFDSLVFEYSNGVLHNPLVTNIIGKIENDDITISVSNNDITDVGEYTLTFSYLGADSGNYIVNEEYKVKVVKDQKAIAGFTVNNYEGIYDGLEHTVSVTGLEEGITAVYDKKAKDVCSNVEVKITFKSSDPNVGITTVAYGYITINPRPITVEFDTTTKLIYNGEKQIPKATLTNVVEGDIVNIVIENDSTKADEYTATALLDNTNYVISNSTALTYEIEKCPVVLAWGPLDLIYSKSILKPTAQVKYNNEILNIEVIVNTDNNINVGTYIATAELSDNNYIIEGSNETSYNIIAKGVSLEWSNKILSYNGEEQLPTSQVTPIDGDNCGVNITGANIVPGTYTATATLTNPNYKIEGSNTTSYTIKNGVLTEEECNSLDYLTTVVYDGNLHGPNIVMVNKYTNDWSLIKYSYEGKKDAGQYYIDVRFYTENGYYDPLTVTVALVINQLEVNIVLNETELRFENSIVRPTFTSTNLVSGDDVSITITNNSSTIGDYVAEFKISGNEKGNYKITNTYNYSIIKGIIDMNDVIFNNTNVTYNGNSQLPTSDNLPSGVSIDLANSISVVNTSDTLAKVKFLLSDQLINNYEIPNDIDVSMTVSKKKLAINWLVTEFGYDGNSHRPTYELIGIENQDEVELIFDSVDGINRGDYEAIVSKVTNDNYYIDSTSCDYKIIRGEYDMSNVIIQNKTFTYDGKSHNNAISVDQAELPLGVLAEYEYESDPIYVGTYKVIIKFSGDSINYEPIPNMEASVIINPALLTISWSDTQFTYDGNSHKPTAEITSSLIGSDECYVSVSGANNDAGTYTASAVLTNSNYKVNDELATIEYTINPKFINVTVYNGSKTGTNFTYDYDGKVKNNMYVTYDESYLVSNDDLDITVNTSNIKALVGTYSYTLVFGNSNYTTSNITGTVTIRAYTIGNLSWYQSSTSSLPYALVNINGEYVRFDELHEDAYYVYFTERNKNSMLDGEPTTAGTYYVYVASDYDGLVVNDYSWVIWSYQQFTYAPAILKEIWSCDGQYNSNLISVDGNKSTVKASFNIDNEEETFNSGLKLESDKGEITFTITKAMKMTIYLTTSGSNPTIYINSGKYSITSGTGTSIELSAGTYTITKGSGSTIVYAIILE